jgi:hypothetical protein
MLQHVQAYADVCYAHANSTHRIDVGRMPAEKHAIQQPHHPPPDARDSVLWVFLRFGVSSFFCFSFVRARGVRGGLEEQQLRRRQYLYFCTSKANKLSSKLSTWAAAWAPERSTSVCTMRIVLLY